MTHAQQWVIHNRVDNTLGLADTPFFSCATLGTSIHNKAPEVKFLHLSDFHVGMDGYAQRRLLDRIVAHVSDRVSKGWRPDLVFITGDVAYSGERKQYEDFRSQFYNPLLEALGGSSWRGKVYAVPGNHDVDRNVASYFDRSQALQPTSRLFDPDKAGKNARSQFAPRLKQYRKEMLCDVSGNWTTSEAGAFYDLFELPDGRFGVVGINTAWLSKDEKDHGQLTPGVYLAETAIRRAAEADLCIVLGHHPIHWLHADHQRRLAAVFGQANVIYLHGHMHEADGRRDRT